MNEDEEKTARFSLHWKLVKRLLFVGLAAVGWIVAVACVNLAVFSRIPSSQMEAKIFRFEKGTPFSTILDQLHDAGVIDYPSFFKFYIVVQHAATRVRAGDYLFPPHITPHQVKGLLLTGDFKTDQVRIIEGWTLKDIANYLERKKMANKEDFLAKSRDPSFIQSLGIHADSLEGYLFPDTYWVYERNNSEQLLLKFVRRFFEIYDENMKAQADAFGFSTNEAVTLASIIEKETGQESERGLVSSVMHNRLKRGIPLAADPTVIYGLKNFDGNLTRRHLQTPTPYNTYLKPGLPVGPIANPGEASLRAAVNPASTNYLYFVAKGDGSHHFSETFTEHQEAVREYQLIQH
ncbi:MAG: endolytic transglycosylase MltG [bacterium]|nr:endolytic transglycosylase MltG [bacterium]